MWWFIAISITVLMMLTASRCRRRKRTINELDDVTIDDMIWLGKTLSKPPSDLLQDIYLVPGCQGRAWLRLNKDGSIDTWADGLIARGLLSLIKRLELRELDSITPPTLSSSRLGGWKSMMKSLSLQRHSLLKS